MARQGKAEQDTAESKLLLDGMTRSRSDMSIPPEERRNAGFHDAVVNGRKAGPSFFFSLGKLRAVVNGWAEAKGLSVGIMVKSFVAGGVAGMVAKSAVAPLDRIKILLQAQNAHYKHLGVFSGLNQIVRREGFLALFRGNGAQMVRIFPYSAIQFSSFELYKSSLPRLFSLEPTSHVVRFVSGSCAGITAVSLTFPLDLVRTRLAFETAHKRRYLGIRHALNIIPSEEGGVRALYRGIFPTLLGMVPYAGFAFYCFEVSKAFCMRHLSNLACTRIEETAEDGSQVENIVVLNVPAKLLCGGLSGAVAQTFSYPLDVARRRMQLAMLHPDTEKFALGTFHTLRLIYREDGIISGLYRGLSINYLRAIPMVSLSFTTYELMKQALNVEANIQARER